MPSPRDSLAPAVAPDPRPIDRLLAPLGAFFSNKLAGAFVLMGAAVVALIWAGSGAGDAYFALLKRTFAVGFTDAPLIEKSLQYWINDGLMGVFFFLVGLEIKRELLLGELASLRKAAFPGIAALGGMVVPASVYLALNAGTPGERGWGVPMATDIAFALGVLSLLGNRVPAAVKVFLTALAIVDDIGAVLVIAIFYTDQVSLVALTLGVVAFAGALGMNVAGIRNTLAYFVLGTTCWFFFLESGVHATVAALMMAFAVPAKTRIDGPMLLDRLAIYMDRLRKRGLPDRKTIAQPEQQALVERLGETVNHASSPLIRLEHDLVGPVTFVVLPVFALANAGVRVEAGVGSAFASPIALGIIGGLVFGKSLGVLLFAWLAVALGLADKPAEVSWRHVAGAAMLSGIGFTMALFIAGLAFPPEDLDTAKVGILAGSLVAGLSGFALLRFVPGEAPAPKEAPA
jgi:NhaA family Na+:H+ antiporter